MQWYDSTTPDFVFRLFAPQSMDFLPGEVNEELQDSSNRDLVAHYFQAATGTVLLNVWDRLSWHLTDPSLQLWFVDLFHKQMHIFYENYPDEEGDHCPDNEIRKMRNTIWKLIK